MRTANTKTLWLLWLLGTTLGAVFGLLVPSVPQKILGLSFLGIFAGLAMLRIPELGLVIAFLAGRFDSLPILASIDGPLYVSLIAILGTVFVVLLRKGWQYRLQAGKYLASVFVFGFVVVSGLAFSTSTVYGVEKAVEYWGYTTPMVILALTLLHNREAYWRFVFALVVVTAILAVAGLVGAVIEGGVSGGRLAVFGGGPNTFGRYVVLGVLSTAAIALRYGRKTLPWTGGLILVYLIACYLSGSRQAIIGLIFSVCLFAIIIWHGRLWQIRWRVAIGVLLMVTAVPLLIRAPQLNIVESSVAYRRMVLLFQEDKGDSVNIRISMAEDAIALFARNPIVGVGTGGYATETYGVDERRYPHNIFFEVMAELGLVGVVSLGAVLAYGSISVVKLLVGRKRRHRSDLVLISYAVSCLGFSLLVAQVSGDLFDNRLIWVFGALSAALPSVLAENDDSQVPGLPERKRSVAGPPIESVTASSSSLDTM